MKIKNSYWLLFFIFSIIFSPLTFANVPQLKDPIITPINGLSVTASPGKIVLTNKTSEAISISSMLLKFDLDQSNVTALWGSPWLNWVSAPFALHSSAVKTFRFINQNNLPNNRLTAGQSITVQYSLIPWNNTSVATNVQLYNVTYPLNPARIEAAVSSSGGSNTITITNTSGETIDLTGAQLRMTYSGQITSSIWGTPWVNWSVTSGSPNYVLTAGSTTKIAPNSNLTISFQGQASPIANIALWVQGGGSTPDEKGNLTINFPGTPPGATTNPTIKITGPSFPQGLTVTGTWGQPYSQKQLQVGSYTFTAPEIKTSSNTYTPSITPNPASVSAGSTTSVNVMYSVQQLGKLFIQMPAMPSPGIVASSLSIQGPDFPVEKNIMTNWGSLLQICSNNQTTCPGLSSGNYTLTLPKVYSTTDSYIPSAIVNPIVVTPNQTRTVEVNYQLVPRGTFTMT